MNLSPEAKQKLLKIARDTIEPVIRGQVPPKFETEDPELLERRGVFVTIKNQGRLRGCLGRFTADKRLIDIVPEMARSSATEDPRFRFDPVAPSELAEIDIEISVLSPLEKIENPLDIELGVHGIYIKRGVQSGCFLPQVATETGWTKEEFLSRCCEGKAGLTSDAWQDADTEVYVFTAEIVSEKEEG